MVRKPSVTFSMIILAVANMFLLSCNDKPLFIELHSTSSESENTSSWDFSEATDYIYDPEKIEFVGGKAQLKEVDQTHERSDFNSGTHVGTYYDSGSQTLRVLGKEHDSLDLRNILTSRVANLKGYWRLESSFIDESGNGNNGVMTGAAAIFNNASKVGAGAAYFDGDDGTENVSLGSSSDLNKTDNFTVVLWFNNNSSTLTSEQGLWSHMQLAPPREGYSLYLDNSLTPGNPHEFKVIYSTGGSNYNSFSGVSVTMDSWNHAAFVRKNGKNRIFLNGVFLQEVIAPDFTSPMETHLGKGFIDNTTRFNGSLDEVAYYDTPLDDSEITSIFTIQSNAFTELSSAWTPHYDKLVGYWKMDGNWQDSSGNGNHGTGNNGVEFNSFSKIGAQAGQFDGVNDSVTISDSATFDSISTELTFSGWLFLDSSTDTTGGPDYRVPFSKGTFAGGFFITLEDNGVSGYRFNTIVGGVNRVCETGGDYRNVTNKWIHLAFSFDVATGICNAYLDGVRVDTSTFASGLIDQTASDLMFSGVANGAGDRRWPGKMDDIALWSVYLNSAEIKMLYERQKQKYAGHYDSPVVDLGTSGSWTNLDAVTSLPFGKEIVAQASESSSDYSSLSGDLSDGLVGYWSFDETSLNSVGGDDFEDKSNNLNHAEEVGGVTLTLGGLSANALSFDGIDDRVVLGASSSILPGSTSFTVSCWVKANEFVNTPANHDYGGRCISIFTNDIPQPKSSKIGMGLYGDNSDSVFVYVNGVGTLVKANAGVIDGRWHLLSATYSLSSGDVHLYVDGQVVASLNGFVASTGDDLAVLGTFDNVEGNLNGSLDEVAIWSRPLTPNEIQQLYRRGANRVKYQVKSCVDSTCACKSFNTAPVGNASDCDGDGIVNSADNDDIYKAEFVGPGGNGVTAFSELFNRDSGNMVFTCNTNTTDSDNDVCVDDEITFTGNPKASSPSFSFFDFPSSSRPLDNRYFQYRVMMEAEENTVCGGGPCLPELTSVEIGPTGRFYSGSPSVVNKAGQSIDRALSSLTVTSTNSCNLSYQISNDGSTFYYWDGASWTSGSNVSESNDLVTLNSKISSFTDQIGLGNFFFRSYLGNSNFSECELDEVQVNKVSR